MLQSAPPFGPKNASGKTLRIGLLQYETRSNILQFSTCCGSDARGNGVYFDLFLRFLVFVLASYTHYFDMFDLQCLLCLWRGKGVAYLREILPQSHWEKEAGVMNWLALVLFFVETSFQHNHHRLLSRPGRRRQRFVNMYSAKLQNTRATDLHTLNNNSVHCNHVFHETNASYTSVLN